MKNLKQLLEGYSEGRITLKEMVELSDKMNDGQSQEAENLLREEWENQLKEKQNQAKNLKPLLNGIHHRLRLEENKPLYNFRRWWHGFQKVAAILILPVIVGFFVLFYSQAISFRISDAYTITQAPMHGLTIFILADGSTIILNNSSPLKFPAPFNKAITVKLTGESYFKPVLHPKMPFHGSTKNLEIKIKSQALNRIAKTDKKMKEVVMQEGQGKFYLKEGKLLGVLSSVKKPTYNIKKQNVTTFKEDALQYSAWKESNLIFKDDNLRQATQRISHLYNADIVWMDNQSSDHFHPQATFVDKALEGV